MLGARRTQGARTRPSQTGCRNSSAEAPNRRGARNLVGGPRVFRPLVTRGPLTWTSGEQSATLLPATLESSPRLRSHATRSRLTASGASFAVAAGANLIEGVRCVRDPGQGLGHRCAQLSRECRRRRTGFPTRPNPSG